MMGGGFGGASGMMMMMMMMNPMNVAGQIMGMGAAGQMMMMMMIDLGFDGKLLRKSIRRW